MAHARNFLHLKTGGAAYPWQRHCTGYNILCLCRLHCVNVHWFHHLHCSPESLKIESQADVSGLRSSSVQHYMFVERVHKGARAGLYVFMYSDTTSASRK